MTDVRQVQADFTFADKYAQNRPDGSLETHAQAAQAVMDMHRKRFAHITEPSFWSLFDGVEETMVAGRIIPSMRSMQSKGAPIEKNNMRLFNCTFSNCDRPRFFAEAFWLLLSGCGVGFGVRQHHVDKLPSVTGTMSRLTVTHVVEDSIEGWADALDALVMSYLQGGPKVVFDFSLIRPKGAPLSWGGLAPGPDGLIKALGAIRRLLASRPVGKKLRPIDCFDIVMHAAAAVLSGGIRRAATICLFDPEDEEMMQAKTGNWYAENKQRENANISAAILPTHGKEVFDKVFNFARQFGEPGIVNVPNRDAGTNPCGEAGLDPVWVWENGEEETGWSMCNLTSVVVGGDVSTIEFHDRCVMAAFVGTLQAAYTNVGYLQPVTKLILERDALLGVSIIGLAEAPHIMDPQILQIGAEIVAAVNRSVSRVIGINDAARATNMKPEGTGTIVVKRLGNGANAAQFKRGIRQQRCKTIDAVPSLFASVNPAFVRPFRDDVLVSFPLETGPGARVEEDEDVVKQIQVVETLQKYWVDPTHRRGRVRHSVSNTIKVKTDEEWEYLAKKAYELRDSVVALAAMGAFSPYFFEEAPFLPVPDGWETADLSLVDKKLTDCKSTEEAVAVVQARYRKMVETGIKPVDYSRVDKKVVAGGLEPACAGGACIS